MPSTIPYDPSLTLGSIVPQNKLQNIEEIAKLQAPADAAKSAMNANITLKRSIDMSIQELLGMGIDTTDLLRESESVGKEVASTAVAYAQAKITAEKSIAPLRSKILAVSSEVESPIDYNRSILKEMPISSDSMQMDVQYFSYDVENQSSQSHAATIASFVSSSLTDLFGADNATEVSARAQSQVNSQHARHNISGTLVIAITCTHKTAQIFSPFILDIDKAVHSWNALFPDSMIKTNDIQSVIKTEALSETKEDKSFSILSGATYGSSFVGMVHVLNSSRTDSSQTMDTIATSLQDQFKIGGWFASEDGGFGVDTSFSNSVKNLLSTQQIQSHCSAVTMGIIPSIKSNAVKLAVQEFADFDPEKEMEQLATLQGTTANDNNTVSSAAAAARTGSQMISLKNATIKATLSSLKDIDDGENQIIDVNSMMTAMDDYIQKCIDGGNNIGVPINYFLKPISKSMITRAWLAKYYPNQYNKSGSIDDSNNTNSTNGSETSGKEDSDN